MNYTEIDAEDDEHIDLLQGRLRVLEDLKSLVDAPTDLPEDLAQYKTVMDDIKRQYTQSMDTLMCSMNRITRVKQKVEMLRASIDTFGNYKYVEMFSRMIDQFEKDEQIDELKRDYDETIRRCRSLKQIMTFVMNEDSNQFTCFTCIERPIQYVFTPCGHTCCAVCYERLRQNVSCPYCRSEIVKIIKLYLG